MGAGIHRDLEDVTYTYEKKLCKLLKRTDVEIVRRRDDNPYSNDSEDIYGLYRVSITDKTRTVPLRYIHCFYINKFPHCCGILISSGANTSAEWRNKGIGTLMNEFRKQIATQLGYTRMICTDVTNNVEQDKILAENGWEKIHTFNNRRSGNTVAIHVVET